MAKKVAAKKVPQKISTPKKIQTWISNQWQRIKVRVPAVVRNFPVASGVLMLLGMLLMFILTHIF